VYPSLGWWASHELREVQGAWRTPFVLGFWI
jgi:hypothetical protein